MPDCLIPADSGVHSVPIDAVTAERLPALLGALLPQAATWLGVTGYAAKTGEVALVPDPDGGIARVLVGFGSGRDVPPLIVGKLPAALPPGAYHLREGFPDLPVAALAWALGAYAFTRYRKASPKPRLVMSANVDGGEIASIADAVYLARDLINTGANDLGPAELAAATAGLMQRYGGSFSEVVGDALPAAGLNLIHAVGHSASAGRAPRLIDCWWGNEGDPLVTIVGKGVCFDTGGPTSRRRPAC